MLSVVHRGKFLIRNFKLIDEVFLRRYFKLPGKSLASLTPFGKTKPIFSKKKGHDHFRGGGGLKFELFYKNYFTGLTCIYSEGQKATFEENINNQNFWNE